MPDKDITAMKKELKGLKATHKRLDAAVAKMDAKKRELKFDTAKDKRMKKDLKKDVKVRRKKEHAETAKRKARR